MTELDALTERGCRDLLASIAECRTPLQVRLRAADAEVALRESEANSLRKLSAMLTLFEEALRARLERFTQ